MTFTKTNIGNHLKDLDRTEKSLSINTGLASGGLKCKLGASYFYSSSVLVDSYCSEIRPDAKPETISGTYKEPTEQMAHRLCLSASRPFYKAQSATFTLRTKYS
jgi:hypothetical protein